MLLDYPKEPVSDCTETRLMDIEIPFLSSLCYGLIWPLSLLSSPCYRLIDRNLFYIKKKGSIFWIRRYPELSRVHLGKYS